MADNRLAFGLCKKYHISLPDDETPCDAWEALKKNGIEYFEEKENLTKSFGGTSRYEH